VAPTLLDVDRMSMRAALGALLLLAGCIEAEPEEGVVSDGKADGISELKLKITKSAGKLRAKESPKLAGAPSGSTSFSCPTEERTGDGWRLLCKRGKEELALTFGPTELAGAAVYKKSTSSPDTRLFFHCEATTSTAPDQWPGELTCTSKQPKSLVNGQMVSPFSSSIDIGIANSHVVAEHASGATLFRGMKPFRDADFEDLQSLDIGAVLIFKRPTSSTEISKETASLDKIGITKIVNEPFGFKDFADFAEPCRQTVRSLAQIVEWTDAGTNTFLHCTVGEDRTGYLAGLYRLLTDSTAEVESIFESELCERGYSSGNPQKPMAGVAREIDADLTPIFLKMAFKIAQGELTRTSLDESVCDVDPAGDAAFEVAKWDAEQFRCSISTRYRL
jgi:hypothetical protein